MNLAIERVLDATAMLMIMGTAPAVISTTGRVTNSIIFWLRFQHRGDFK